MGRIRNQRHFPPKKAIWPFCNIFQTHCASNNRPIWTQKCQKKLFFGDSVYLRYFLNNYKHSVLVKRCIFLYDAFLAEVARAFLAAILLIIDSLRSNAGATSSQMTSCSSRGMVRKYSRMRSYFKYSFCHPWNIENANKHKVQHKRFMTVPDQDRNWPRTNKFPTVQKQ